MLGDGRLAHAEIFRHGIQGKRLPCQHPEHGPPRRIGNGLKDISSRFHAIENYSGENLDWFWRGWFLNNWKVDQAVKSVEYISGDSTKGAIITIENIGQLPMPVTVEIKQANGKTERVKLPVEIWQHGSTWKFRYNSTDKITDVTIDPDKRLPDVNDANNSLDTANKSTALLDPKTIEQYVGSYSSTQTAIKVVIKNENNVLMMEAVGQASFPLNQIAKDKFDIEDGQVTIEFHPEKNEFVLTENDRHLLFTKEKHPF